MSAGRIPDGDRATRATHEAPTGLHHSAGIPCACDICTRHAKFQEHLSRLPEEDKAFWYDIYETANCVEMDLNYAEAVLDGSWASSVEQLIEALSKAVAIRNERKGWGV